MIKVVKKQPVQWNIFKLQGFPLGLNTSVHPTMLSPIELSKCVDFRIGANGELINREAIIAYTTVATTGDPVSLAYAVVGGTSRDIIGCSDYKIYYLSTTTPTLIGTVESTPYLIPYNDVCLICDGSYLKYIDGVTEIKIAYDAGTDGIQFDNYSGDDDEGLKIGNGTNTRVAVKFTSDTWTAGYTIPITQIDCKLKKVLSPTGTITAKLRLVADDSILATKDLSQDAADISTDGEFVSFVFSSSDITTEMSTGVAYYASIEFAGGDATNYLELRSTTTTGTAYEYYSGAWHADTTAQPIIKVQPGVPPKCSFGVVSNRRPWLAGDPDNKGYIWYGNLSHLDWSTTNGGGWVGVIDDNNNSFEVGGVQDLYGDLFVYGTKNQPYLSKLSGSDPSDFVLPLTFQQAWTKQRTLVNIKTDLWSGASDGVDSLTGVQEYGDFRVFSLTESVADRIEDHWSDSTAFAGYYPKHGQYWLYMPTHGKVLVGHTRHKVTGEVGKSRYPWTEYDLPVTPTCFGQLSTGFMIGADDGHLYYPTASEYKDLTTTQIEPYFETAYIEFPLPKVTIEQIQFIAASLSGVYFKVNFYIDGNDTNYLLQLSEDVSMSDGLLVTDATGLLTDATVLVSTSTRAPKVYLNFSCDSLKLRFHSLKMFGDDQVSFNGCFFKYRQLQG